MIYLFDRQKKLQKIIPKKHLLSATQTVELNGLYQLSVEVPLFYETKEGTQYNHKKNIEKAWFAGHYDRQKRFQLYKIHARKISVKNDGTKVIIVDGVHIFFDEAKAMGNIHDRRFRDTDVKAPADAAFNSIGWYIKDYDVTDRADITFYRDSVANARSLIIEKFDVEFDYGLTFDGRKIISKDLYIKKRLGRWTGKRFAYGTNLLSLSQEEDESEVYTAAVGRGKGEEIGEGHGPRIEFGDIEWSKDGITKPAGQNWIEIPSATAEYGFYENGELKPRIAAEVIFENTENKKLIADSTYYWLLENCVPKAVWKTDVAKSGIHDLGDSVGVIYKKADIVKISRVHKMENNLLDDALSKITLGDYQHFKTDKRQQSIRAQIKRNHADNQSVITQMKNDFDARFDAQTTAIDNAYQQAVIDANADIEAAEVRMQEELDTQRQAMINDIEQAEQAAKDAAAQNLADTAERINTTIDTTRSDIERNIAQEVQSAKDYADTQATAKADSVQSNLDSFKTVHQQMYNDVTADIIDINEFLGPQTEPLTEMLNNMEMTWQNKLNNVDTWHYNMLRETQSLNSGYWEPVNGVIEENVNGEVYYRKQTTGANVSALRSKEPKMFNAGETYTLSFDVQTYDHRSMDYIWILDRSETGEYDNYNISYRPDEQTADVIYWGSDYQRYYIKFTLQKDVFGVIQIGGLTQNNELGDREFRIKKPYLTQSGNINWLYHPEDSQQNIEEVVRRITQLEDGYEEFITRTEYDNRTGEIDGTIRQIKETVDESTSIIANHENFITTNGSALLQTVDDVMSKVWMDDFVNPNMLRYTNVSDVNHRIQWEFVHVNSTGSSYVDWFHVRNTVSHTFIAVRSTEFSVVEGETYTASFEAWENGDDSKNTTGEMDYTFITSAGNTSISSQGLGKSRKLIGNINGANIYKYIFTFTAPYTVDNARLLVGTRTNGSGLDASFRFKSPKVEVGGRATAYHTSFSTFQQTVDEMSLTVQDIEGNAITESEVFVGTSGVQIGSTYIGDEEFSSIFSVSPRTIDVITEKMRITGDLAVAGDIESISMSAMRGEFANLFAAEVEAGTVKAQYINGLTAEFEYMYTLNANIERLVAQNVFTNAVTTKSLEAIEANFGRVQTAILKADVINGKHVEANSLDVTHIKIDNALINTISARSAFINEVKTMSIDAVYADLRSVNSEIMTSNIINSNWLNVDTALFNRFTSSTAFIESLTAKTVFAREVSAITIDAVQANLTTVMNSMGEVEGGLSIRRPDGAYAVNNGMIQQEYVVSSYSPMFMDQTAQGLEVYYSVGRWWRINERIRQDLGTSRVTFNAYQFIHSARYLEIEVAYVRNETGIHFNVDSFGGGYSFSGYHGHVRGGSGGTDYKIMKIDLGVPSYTKKAFYLKVTPNGEGASESLSREIRFRILKVVQTDF